MKVPCTRCRGAKKTMKLGGLMGECGVCEGTGFIDNSGELSDAKEAIGNDFSMPKRERKASHNRRK